MAQSAHVLSAISDNDIHRVTADGVSLGKMPTDKGQPRVTRRAASPTSALFTTTSHEVWVRKKINGKRPLRIFYK